MSIISCSHRRRLCALILCVISNLACAQDSTLNSLNRFHVFIEVIGHNYQPYVNDLKPTASVNFGYRLRWNNYTGCLLSVGYGLFNEKYSTQLPLQPRVDHSSWVSFVPFEVTVQIGKKNNFFEIGGTFVQAWGNHSINYTGSQGSSATRVLREGHQYIFRIGYLFIKQSGLFFRIAITPHYYDAKFRTYAQKVMDRATWIPVGLSFGYTF